MERQLKWTQKWSKCKVKEWMGEDRSILSVIREVENVLSICVTWSYVTSNLTRSHHNISYHVTLCRSKGQNFSQVFTREVDSDRQVTNPHHDMKEWYHTCWPTAFNDLIEFYLCSIFFFLFFLCHCKSFFLLSIHLESISLNFY